MQHILSAKQFTSADIKQLFAQAAYMETANRQTLAARRRGLIAATLFYEPSTRTRLSFESAAQRIGMGVISTENAGEFSSAVKGETIEDTIRTVSQYADVIIMRHKEKGAFERAATVSEVPLINAGDGDGEHPTQALLDLYTIQRQKGRSDHLHVVIGGDLIKGRTARSLALLLSKYKNNTITFVSLPELRIGDDIKRVLTHGTNFTETTDMTKALAKADVVYWTRLQLERHNGDGVSRGKTYIIDKAALRHMKKDAIILHPLPRNNEIASEVDADSRAVYFDQVKNGLYLRMALLDTLI